MARRSRKEQPVQEEAQPERRWRTAGYVRLSVSETRDREDGEALQNQRELVLRYIEVRPELELGEIYTDESVIFEPSQKPLAAQGFLVWFDFFVPPQWATMT